MSVIKNLIKGLFKKPANPGELKMEDLTREEILRIKRDRAINAWEKEIERLKIPKKK